MIFRGNKSTNKRPAFVCCCLVWLAFSETICQVFVCVCVWCMCVANWCSVAIKQVSPRELYHVSTHLHHRSSEKIVFVFLTDIENYLECTSHALALLRKSIYRFMNIEILDVETRYLVTVSTPILHRLAEAIKTNIHNVFLVIARFFLVLEYI